MTKRVEQNGKLATSGIVLHRAACYDLLIWLATRGKEREFRDRCVHLARLAPGEGVLDVGCGTGTLAIAAKQRVGVAGTVCRVDASPEMIARAKGKAAQVGVEVHFQESIAESLPFPDGSFDAVVTTLMLHHLGPKARRQSASKVLRVLRPYGRWLLVDFEGPAQQHGGLLKRIHRHGHIKPGALGELVSETGLSVVESGPLGIRNLHFILAGAPHREDDPSTQSAEITIAAQQSR